MKNEGSVRDTLTLAIPGCSVCHWLGQPGTCGPPWLTHACFCFFSRFSSMEKRENHTKCFGFFSLLLAALRWPTSV
jgi:hypothetical protein